MANTVYVAVSGGLVENVYKDEANEDAITVVVMDFDNEGCECNGADSHSHETYEFPGPEIPVCSDCNHTSKGDCDRA